MTSNSDRQNVRVSISEASIGGADEVVGSSSRTSVATVKENKPVSSLTGADTAPTNDIRVEETVIRNRHSRQSFQGPAEENSYFCRICHALGSKRRLLSPCLCRGSISLVHRRCLERWLAESDTNVCEICGFEYKIQRLPKYGLFGSMWAWVFSPRNSDKRKLLLLDLSTGVLLLLISYVCSIIGGRALVFEPPPNTSSNPQALILTRLIQTFIICSVIILNMGVMAWTIYRFQYHFRDWYAWYRRHCIVILLGYDRAEVESKSSIVGNTLRIKDSPAQASSSSSSISTRVIVY